MTDALGYVYGYAASELDYCAALYYDPTVMGRLFEGGLNRDKLVGTAYDEGSGNWDAAKVYVEYLYPKPDEIYETYSSHGVVDISNGARIYLGSFRHAIRFIAPNQCQPGQSFAPNGNPCPMPSPSPSPSPDPTPNPTPTPESITLIVDAGLDQYIRPAETGGISKAPLTVIVRPAGVRSVRLTLEVAAGSGGHIDAAHVGGNVERPKGTFDRERTELRGMTDASGVLRTNYQASVFNGRTKITATAADLSTDVILDVKVPDLVELFEGDNYNLIGFAGIAAHPAGTNHWGTFRANQGLREIANAYAAKFYPNEPIPENKKLHYNDQSLPQGGKFDVDARWSLAHLNHDEHRVGINCDVRCCRDPGDVPTDRWRELNEIFVAHGSTDTNDETKKKDPHWHLRFEFGENIPNGFASNVTSFVPNVSWATLERNLSDADWSYWTGRLETAQAQGDSQTLTVAKEYERSMFQSAEYVNRNRSDADYVTDLHVGYWMREPTTAEHEQSLNRLRGDNAQGLNGREILRQNFENSQGFANAVGTLEGTHVPPSCDAVQEQDCYNNGGSWDTSTCDCTNINPEPYPDPCWNGSYYTCE